MERRKAAYFPAGRCDPLTLRRIGTTLCCYSDLGEFALRTTMDALEKRLDPAEFARVSRSAIVRVAAIREIRQGDEVSILILNSGAEVACSKKYWTAALDRLL